MFTLSYVKWMLLKIVKYRQLHIVQLNVYQEKTVSEENHVILQILLLREKLKQILFGVVYKPKRK